MSNRVIFKFIFGVITLCLSLSVSVAQADSSVGLLGSSSEPPPLRWTIAQMDEVDAYDPFVDYSEFEEASDEEADINFFRNGRFFTLGFVGGYRGLTETQASMFEGAVNYGLFLSYFFDLRFALQLSYAKGDHAMNFTTKAGSNVKGSASLSDLSVSLKYYVNTQNVTRGLAQFNPYFLGGLSQYTRTTRVSGEPTFGKEEATGFTLGVGIELPMLRNKMYFGAQASFSLVTFADEQSEIQLENDQDTDIYPTGDPYSLYAIIGVNF